jgi:radical SAM protein with 4Fe4S-binding SPASM domain
MLKKAYLEITNACNLRCSFCHGTKREIKFLSAEEFTLAAKKLRGITEYLYFHLMGEPLLHPMLPDFFRIAGELGFKVILTTNGTLLPQKAALLLEAAPLHKVSISLHCYEANDIGISLEEYLRGCFDFCAKASAQGIIAVMRLWNIGGEDKLNRTILNEMHATFPGEWVQTRSGYRLQDKVFLEWGERFEWPDPEAEYVGSKHTCYGLRDQIGVLSNGTIVPCCLDAEGNIPLGNIFTDDLNDVLASPRASALKQSFENRNITEELCLRCGFAGRMTVK